MRAMAGLFMIVAAIVMLYDSIRGDMKDDE